MGFFFYKPHPLVKLSELFLLHPSDRKVLSCLLALATVVAMLIYFVGNDGGETQLTAADSLAVKKSERGYKQRNNAPYASYKTADGRRVELFPFDPNTADSTQLLRLGLQPWQVRAIYKYRAKGGIYRTPHDFGRLYGMTRQQYETLEPYIRIGDDYQPAYTQFASRAEEAQERYEAYEKAHPHAPYKEYDRDTLRYPVKLKPGQQVNLATADTTLLKKIPGIGSAWARRIVQYRDRLGGFYSVSQLRDMDEFPTQSLPYLSLPTATATTKLNLNQLSLSQLRRHPYINYFQAKAICDYRRLKGPLKSIDQLRLLQKDFPPEAIERLRHYVTF